jgi:hypothetical protein
MEDAYSLTPERRAQCAEPFARTSREELYAAEKQRIEEEEYCRHEVEEK